MKIKQLVDEDFINYKKPSMLIGFPYCNFKCERECGKKVCQNSTLSLSPEIEISYDKLVNRYLSNEYSDAVICGGLEPFDSYKDLYYFISNLRIYTEDDVVIYTGYNEDEIKQYITDLSANFKNIIIKFGRYIPDQKPHYDEVLGVKLASDNQYARKIS